MIFPNPHTHIPNPMVAEPFIFLSEDRQVEVRCCRTKDTNLFCVKDFIRRTANRRMGPVDAVRLWMHISSALHNEHDIVNSFVYKFPGPYERPNVCINANGLLVLYHHMDTMHGLVNEKYRDEVNQRLLQVVSGRGGQYIEEYDDGEIDAQMAEEDSGSTEPLEKDSRAWYVPMTGMPNGEEIPVEMALEMQKRENEGLCVRLAEMKESDKRCCDALNQMKKRIAELEKEKLPASLLCKRGNTFTLGSLVKHNGLSVLDKFRCKLFKRVVARFKIQFPATRLNKHHRVTYFSAEHRDDAERILHSEFLRMELERTEKEHWVNCKSGG